MSLYPNVREGNVVVDGAKVHFYDSGGVGDPPVVLLPGLDGSATTDFWALFPMIAMTRRVITLDFNTSQHGQNLTFEDFVAQTEAVIEELSPGVPVALVGYSIGAVVAAAFAARHPALVSSLVLVAGWMRADRHQVINHGIWRHLLESESPILPDFTVYGSYSADYLRTRTERDYQEIAVRSQRTTVVARVLEIASSVDIEKEAHTIGAPTLVIGCTHDYTVDVNRSRELFGAIHNSRYAEIEAGHAVVQERPAELCMLIDTFVAAPYATSPGDIYARSQP
ncbi:alpha/beta fold hydrolase [Paenarthrobacter aurescens]|uniref:alpha/beta fold hydrolase n=1 Tax=Paenarthrobacter aurescens TaxID=43663 RepID=UPI0035E9346D